jgi:hypothetical protein
MRTIRALRENAGEGIMGDLWKILAPFGPWAVIGAFLLGSRLIFGNIG